MAVTFTTDPEAVAAQHLNGFFVGWSQLPTPSMFIESLRNSYRVVLAWDGETLVGFITCISDGLLFAYIPLLEVLPSHQGKTIGRELVSRLVNEIAPLYAIDLCCDAKLVPYYERLGFTGFAGAGLRDRSALGSRSVP